MISLVMQPLMEVWEMIQVNTQTIRIHFSGKIMEMVEEPNFIMKEIWMIFSVICLEAFLIKETSEALEQEVFILIVVEMHILLWMMKIMMQRVRLRSHLRKQHLDAKKYFALMGSNRIRFLFIFRQELMRDRQSA